MNSFKFNFTGETVSEPQEVEKITEKVEKEPVQWLECEEVTLGSQIEQLDDIAAHAKMFVCDEVEIGHVIAKDALLRMGDRNLSNVVELAEKEHSDLVAGKYEGGLKIWECTFDLIHYLEKKKVLFQNKNVLDLGCGAGILGVYTFMNDAKVTFQDYNKEVLECVTIPNVLLNADEEEREYEISRCKFYSGDWASFNEKLPETEMFDFILSSETIYNIDNYNKLIDLILTRLAPAGVAYVAAKTHYFGVGGGTKQFQKIIDSNTLLKSEVCWKSLGGIQREIIKITRNQDLFIID